MVVQLGIGVAREGTKCTENIVILCFERRFSKQNNVIRLKIKHFGPQIFGLGTPLQLGNSCTE